MFMSLMGCITPSANDRRGVNSPMLNAFQAAQPKGQPNPFSFPLTGQSQAYALTGGVLVIMVFVIIKASQMKDK